MVNSTLSRDDTLPAFLATRARAASDGRLVVDVAVGLLGALGIAFWHPAAWVIPFCVAMFLTMFGAWGIAEREITERPDASGRWLVRLLRFGQLVAIAIGVLAMVVAGFTILRLALGNWIS